MNQTLAAPAPAADNRLRNFPIAWFSSVMGLAGLAIAWSRAEHILGLPVVVSPYLIGITALVFFTLTVLYATKAMIHPDAVAAELGHPVKLAFAPAFSIALLLLAIALIHIAPQASFRLWAMGALLHLAATLYVLSSWLHHRKYEIAHMNPAWFIPVVGNILVPVVGVQHAPAEISWFFFSLGLFFWPLLSAILFHRLIFHGSLPERLMPTLFIFIAPPAVGFIAWYNLVGELDSFGRVLYYIALAFGILLLSQARHFMRLNFFLSWWAYSFPLAALTIATLLMAKLTGIAVFTWLGTGSLALLSVAVAGLVTRTIISVARREICVEGH